MKWVKNKYSAALFSVWLAATQAQAGNASFTRLLTEGERAEKNGDMPAALRSYSQAEPVASSNSADLCALTKDYCDLMYSTDSAVAKKHLLELAVACASRAVMDDPKSSTAHACMAVCYAKESAYADIKAKVTYSRLIKKEAEEAIVLNPKQDVAYYLLGRWNYGVANIGLLSRAYVKVVYGGLPSASNELSIKDFEQAIALAPGHIIYYAGLANVYETMGEKNLALAEWKKCIGMRPLDRDDRDAQQQAINELSSISK